MEKVLFLIHDLGQGGAEKVLVNLVNNMDDTKFDITVMTLFDVGVNKQFLKPSIKYKSCFKTMIRGNSHIMKLFTPKQLHKWFIKDKYDIEVSYLEGPCARIISGCDDEATKLVSWIHIEQKTAKRAVSSFRNEREAVECYNRFDRIICVSKTVQEDFTRILSISKPMEVLFNTNETKKIKEFSKEETEINFDSEAVHLIGVGKLLKNKGFDRMLRILNRLTNEKYNVALHVLGIGPMQQELENYVREHNLQDKVTFWGYQTNPYKYVAKCNLFVCASYAEGFSTAATEALIVGTPVCTVEVSGMKEMLGENNEYGLVVENDDEALYKGIKRLLDNPELLEYYRLKAIERGKEFSTEKTVKAVEEMLERL